MYKRRRGLDKGGMLGVGLLLFLVLLDGVVEPPVGD